MIGVNRCDLCPQNTFSNETGMEYCIECPDGMITDATGAVSSTDCYRLSLSSTTTRTTTDKFMKVAQAAAGGFNAIFVILGIAGLFAFILIIILLCILVKK